MLLKRKIFKDAFGYLFVRMDDVHDSEFYPSQTYFLIHSI